jgi:hypothetical protein
MKAAMEFRLLIAAAGIAALLAGALNGCTNPTQSDSGTVMLDRNTVADLFGNHDGVASSQEVTTLNEYFSANAEAWCITDLPEESWTSQEVTAGQVKSYVEGMATHPYSSEEALRRAYEGASIRTPFVSVSVLRPGSSIAVTKFYRAPGPNISASEWEELSVK